MLGLPQNAYGQYYILQSLKKFFEVEFLSFNSYDKEFNNSIYFNSSNYKSLKIIRLLLTGRSTRLTHYWSNNFFNAYKDLINKFEPDIIYVDNVLMMQYPLTYKVRSKIWFYDDESNLFVIRHNLRKNLIEKLRNIGLAKLEKNSIIQSERTFCITENETKYLNSLGFRNVLSLPYLINDKHYYYNWAPSKDEFSILFIGDFAHYPNREAAKIICCDIYSGIKSIGIKVVLVGRNFSKIKKYLRDDITTFENVADVRPFYWMNSIFVAPIFSGGGMRIKILEAAACGIPIIMTPLANLGINLEHKKDAIILSKIPEIVDYIKTQAIPNINQLTMLSKNANEKIRLGFSIDRMEEYYATEISKVCES